MFNLQNQNSITAFTVKILKLNWIFPEVTLLPPLVLRRMQNTSLVEGLNHFNPKIQ